MTTRAAVCGLVLAAAALAGCGQGGAAATPPAGATAGAAATSPARATAGAAATSRRGGDGRRGRGARPAAAGALPADWPDLPLPEGTVSATSGGGTTWSVQLQVAGSADDVRRRTEAFYTARGFATTDTVDVLVRGALRLVVVAENRDHDAASTTLVLGLERR